MARDPLRSNDPNLRIDPPMRDKPLPAAMRKLFPAPGPPHKPMKRERPYYPPAKRGAKKRPPPKKRKG